MPVDNYEDDSDNKDDAGSAGPNRKFSDFDCPGCSANNPVGDSFGDGDELTCHYCGSNFAVKVTDEGRLKLKEM